MAFCALVAAGALAQVGPTHCPGYVVELTITGIGASQARVSLRDGNGQVFDARIADDGRGVDPVAGDGIWCAPLPPICRGPLSFGVELGGQRRTLVLHVPDEAGDQPRIRATLDPGGLRGEIVRGEPEASTASGPVEPPPEGAVPQPAEPEGPAPHTPPPAGVGPPPSEDAPRVQDRWMPVPAAGNEPIPGEEADPLLAAGRRRVPPDVLLRGWAWGWSVVLALALTGGALAWTRARRRRDERVRAAWRALPRRGGPPTSLAAGDLAAALEGPLATSALVVIGQTPGGVPADSLRLESGAMPGDILAALLRVEAARGRPATLLVLEPAALGAWHGDALDELQELVADRFTVWVVEGPADWARWTPAAPA